MSAAPDGPHQAISSGERLIDSQGFFSRPTPPRSAETEFLKGGQAAINRLSIFGRGGVVRSAASAIK